MHASLPSELSTDCMRPSLTSDLSTEGMMHPSLPSECKCTVSSCFRLLPPHPPHHEGLVTATETAPPLILLGTCLNRTNSHKTPFFWKFPASATKSTHPEASGLKLSYLSQASHLRTGHLIFVAGSHRDMGLLMTLQKPARN